MPRTKKTTESTCEAARPPVCEENRLPSDAPVQFNKLDDVAHIPGTASFRFLTLVGPIMKMFEHDKKVTLREICFAGHLVSDAKEALNTLKFMQLIECTYDPNREEYVYVRVHPKPVFLHKKTYTSSWVERDGDGAQSLSDVAESTTGDDW